MEAENTILVVLDSHNHLSSSIFSVVVLRRFVGKTPFDDDSFFTDI